MHGLVSLKASTTEQLSILGGCQPRLAFEQRTERRRISVPHLLGDPFDAGAAVAEHCHLATDAATRHDLQATDFEVLDFRDTTEMTHCEARAAEKLEAEGLSPFGLGLLFGSCS